MNSQNEWQVVEKNISEKVQKSINSMIVLLDKLTNKIDKLEIKLNTIEKTTNTLNKQLTEYHEEYDENKEVYIKILNKLLENDEQVKPILNELTDTKKSVLQSLIMPSRIYNRLWRSNCIGTIVPITKDIQ